MFFGKKNIDRLGADLVKDNHYERGVTMKKKPLVMALALLACGGIAHAELGKDWVLATPSAPWPPARTIAVGVYQGKMWVSMGYGGQGGVWRSSDGENWTKTAGEGDWIGRNILPTRDGKMYSVNGGVWETENGAVWTEVLATGAPSWGSLVELHGVFFGIGGGNATVTRSPNLIDWTQLHLVAPFGWRDGHATVAHNDKIWVLGGHSRSSDVWSSPNGVAWTLVTESAGWSDRSLHAAVAADGKIWVMGGSPEGSPRHIGDVWSSPDGLNWTMITEHAPWGPLRMHASVVYRNKIWIIGGEEPGDGYTFTKKVWYSEIPVPETAAKVWQTYE